MQQLGTILESPFGEDDTVVGGVPLDPRAPEAGVEGEVGLGQGVVPQPHPLPAGASYPSHLCQSERPSQRLSWMAVGSVRETRFISSIRLFA